MVADTALKVGETTQVTVTFSEAVTGFTDADMSIANGTLTALSSSDGGITWTAAVTPGAGITNPTNLITLANSGMANAAGHAGSGTTDFKNYWAVTVESEVMRRVGSKYFHFTDLGCLLYWRM